MATCTLIIQAEDFVSLLIKGQTVPVCVCVEMQPLGRTREVTAAGWVTSVGQGTKQPGAELQMRIAWSAVKEKLESNLWSWQIKSCLFECT